MQRKPKNTMSLWSKRRVVMAHSAAEIYFDLIARIRAKVKADISIVYDPETGIQKHFLKGKLLKVKKVSDGTKPNSNNL